MNDFERVSPTAVEEIVRWATPVIHFRRLATRDVNVGGQEIKAGQKVVLFYNSANRDERAFEDPFRFDVTRTPNEHVGFGAGGPHFCLGANLARLEARIMFEALLTRFEGLAVDGDTAALPRVHSNLIDGFAHLPVRWDAVASSSV
jgi:cholest-4-en-3-one 26-monooxygenase